MFNNIRFSDLLQRVETGVKVILGFENSVKSHNYNRPFFHHSNQIYRYNETLIEASINDPIVSSRHIVISRFIHN